MLTRERFAARFGHHALFGMVHLAALPGAPLFSGSLDEVLERAAADARALIEGGCQGLLFENFGDRPFFKCVRPETVACMTRVIAEVMSVVRAPFGVNVLRNDAHAALAVAAATGADFIRVNVHAGVMVTDQGIIEGDAAETLRLRSTLAPDVLIFADHMVKHAAPPAAIDERQAAKDLRMRALADGIIISGSETGAPPDRRRLQSVRAAVDAPLLIGSGLTAENAADYSDADGAIAGTSLKREGAVEQAVDAERVRRVVSAFKRRAGR